MEKISKISKINQIKKEQKQEEKSKKDSKNGTGFQELLDEKGRQIDELNQIGLGPAGFGGRTTAMSVRILTYPTHIAGLPVAVNICCHVNRHESRCI